MEPRTDQILFCLLRSAICGTKLKVSERACVSEDRLSQLIAISKKHDIVHLLELGLQNNGLTSKADVGIQKSMLMAAYRYEHMNYVYVDLCETLESSRIPFIPLKGSILRNYYPEAWMRTSCDIDILIHQEDLENTISILTEKCGYAYQGKGSHDVSLTAPNKVHIELHYNLMEDGRINKSSEVLQSVWATAVIREGYSYWYEMPDEMFYFYHIAHMAKHFESGGCGIRPFIDLWILENLETANPSKRAELIRRGNLEKFAEAAVKLSRIWFEDEEKDAASARLEAFIVCGGVYGTLNNTAMVKAAQGESKMQNLVKLIFLPKRNLEKIYPNLEKYPILFPCYQVMRWFRIINKDKREKIKYLTYIRNSVSNEDIDLTAGLLAHLGLAESH